jgi:hypothetical protein
MKANMGSTDKMLRIIVAIVIAILFFTNVISGVLGIILLILAGIFVVTSLINFCPIYALLGMNTKGKNK